ncbi:MAG: Smr/MutS family protein [Treponema sp.]|nr:Smr/MutS family protein [Treponema sp.]
MEVLAGPSRLRGRALRRDRKAGGSWIVETGSVRVRFPETELVPAFPGGAPASGTARPFPGPGRSPSAPSPGGSWTADLAPADLKPELNLLGMRLEEALEALRRQIDGALLAGLGGFAVIHGKGDGILQRGVRDYLAGERAVADFYFARPELGGSGRTEVVLQG